MSKTKPPSKKEFLSIVNADDPMVVTVKGHQCIEAVLNMAISEALSMPHTLEIRRLNFAIKTDLAIALGTIPQDCRAAFLQINAIRNLFAHDPRAALSKVRARKIYNSFSPYLRHALHRRFEDLGDPLNVVRWCQVTLFMVLRQHVTRMRDEKVQARVLHEIAEETLQPYSAAEEAEHDPDLDDIDDRITKEIEKERRKRTQEGDL